MRTNKPSKDGLIGVHVSSMVNEVIRTISREFIFALRKNSPNAPKLKTNDFHPLKSFCARKIVAFVVFCLLNFVLLVGFDLWCVFYAQKFFVKEINCLGIALITSFTILLLICALLVLVSRITRYSFRKSLITHYIWNAILQEHSIH